MIDYAAKRYRNHGLRGVLRSIPIKIIGDSPITKAVQRTFGPQAVQRAEFFENHGYWPNLENPRSFSEKIRHRVLFTDDPLYAQLTDKHAVREYVRDRVNDDILTELYHVTDDPQTIPFGDLPEQFVVKSTHASGHVHVVTDKQSCNREAIVAECEEWLNEVFGLEGDEYWYQQITPQIIVEEYINAPEKPTPQDYKFYVFDGRVRVVHVDMNRYGSSEHTRPFYDRDWNPVDIEINHPATSSHIRPNGFERMREVAEQLGNGIDFVRVDLYNPYGNKVIFGEMTFSPGAGREKISPTKRDFQLGSYWLVS